MDRVFVKEDVHKMGRKMDSGLAIHIICHSKTSMLKSNSQHGGIWMWDLWKAIWSQEQSCREKNPLRVTPKGDITTETEEIQKNHQILLQKPIFNTTGKSKWTEPFSRQILNSKVKSVSEKPCKQCYNPERTQNSH